MKVLVTGSSGLIGSEAVQFYDSLGATVIGIDNNMRRDFFGPTGDTTWNLLRLKKQTKRFRHFSLDIRHHRKILKLFETHRFDLIVHCAAQPSHDRARDIILTDFEVNALGTLHLLEAARRFCRDAVFIHMSTNKVYGDRPNLLPLVEHKKRYDYASKDDYQGIREDCSIDQCVHSFFGVSKVSADVMAQEYGRNFGMPVGIFRGGCLTGPSHSGVELHGFLNYLVKCALSGESYTVFGYKGKQVRDNLHSYDVIRIFEEFRKAPKPGEVYNLGGGRENSISILEAFDMIKAISGKSTNWDYDENHRIGDHICYISDLSKIKTHFPDWKISRSIRDIIIELIQA